MNILLTSVGRRSYLAEWFKEEIRLHGGGIARFQQLSFPAFFGCR